jgi:orotidine-5'-phosphate decarboxylase
MAAAVAARPKPLIWGVTVLTSFGPEDLRRRGLPPPLAQVLLLARMAQSGAWTGWCVLRKKSSRFVGPEYGCPSSRREFNSAIMWGRSKTHGFTPQEAWGAGATHLVVGRSILEAPNPAQTAREILKLRRAYRGN